MTATLDLSAILIALAVVVVVGGFFAYVAYRFWSFGGQMSIFLDGRAERQRQRLAYEEKHGQPPAWKQALRRIVQILLVLAALGLAWLKFSGA